MIPDGPPRPLAQVTDLPALLAKAHDIALRDAQRRLGRAAIHGRTASDVAQSVVKSMFDHAHELEYRDMPGFEVLVHRMVEHEVAGTFRRAYADRRDAKRDVPVQDLTDSKTPGHDPGPEAVAAANELQGRLETALRSSSELGRRVLELRLQGLTHPEIAARLGISLENSTKLLQRLRSRLERTLLDDAQ